MFEVQLFHELSLVVPTAESWIEWPLEILFGLCGGGIWLTLLYFEIWVRITGRGAPSGNDLATELFLFSSCLSSGYFPFLWGFSEKVTEPLQKTILLLNDNDSLFLWLAGRRNCCPI